MNSWIQNQNQNQNNTIMGQAQFNPYSSWSFPNAQPRTFNQPLPTYKAEPIHGENAAWQVPMGPNSEIYLPDADEDLIWWIRTDSNGSKSIIPFDVTPHKKPEPVDINEILARLGAVEEWINGKQNKSNAKRNAAATVPANPAGSIESVN